VFEGIGGSSLHERILTVAELELVEFFVVVSYHQLLHPMDCAQLLQFLCGELLLVLLLCQFVWALAEEEAFVFTLESLLDVVLVDRA